MQPIRRKSVSGRRKEIDPARGLALGGELPTGLVHL